MLGKEKEDKSRIPKIHSKWRRNEQGGGGGVGWLTCYTGGGGDEET